MRILLIGGGGREHAIACALARSPRTEKLYCLPGNAGISEVAECIEGSVMDFEHIAKAVKEKNIDTVFVAPDDPLYGGLVNRLEQDNVRCFGPRKEAAIIEGSKAFSKEFMAKYNIPTASYRTFDNYDEAKKYIEGCPLPTVIKADGLALGKGVIIAETRDDARKALEKTMLDKAFGNAGNTVVIEEFLTGKEFTLLAFCDGKSFSLMPTSQDHKRAYDGDKGPNTGGMGAFSPASVYSEEVMKETVERIVVPTVNGLIAEGRPFKDVLYFVLMATENGVKVIEYNARFGDPETQVILPLLKTDLTSIVDACIDGTLSDVDVEWEDGCSFCVVMASGGYPGKIVKGYPITIGDLSEDIKIYHSGTAFRDGQLVTNGGRVLCVTTKGKTIAECREKVYSEIEKISFKDSEYRRDIGIK